MMRRTLFVTLLLIIGFAGPGHASHGKTPTLQIRPNCGSESIEVEGFDFTPDTIVYISFDGVRQTKVRADSEGWFSTMINPGERPPGDHQVTADELKPSRHSALQNFRVPCPSLELTPTCLPAGTQPKRYVITIRGLNFVPTGESTNSVSITFAPGVAEQTFRAVIDAKGSFVTQIDVAPRPKGTYAVVATDIYSLQAQATFTVPCTSEPPVTPPSSDGTPTGEPGPRPSTDPRPPAGGDDDKRLPPPTPGVSCSLDPALGPPGFVTLARCIGFTPGATVTLRWSPGIGGVGVTADVTGAFVTQFLVMPRDVLGERGLVAEGSDKAVGGSRFLVVPPTVQPAGTDVTQIVRLNRLMTRR